MSEWVPNSRDPREEGDNGLFARGGSDAAALLDHVQETLNKGWEALGGLLDGDPGTYDRSKWSDALDAEESQFLGDVADEMAKDLDEFYGDYMDSEARQLNDALEALEQQAQELPQELRDEIDSLIPMDEIDEKFIENLKGDIEPDVDLDRMTRDLLGGDYGEALDPDLVNPVPKGSLYDGAASSIEAAERAAERIVRQEADAATYNWVKDRDLPKDGWGKKLAKGLAELPVFDLFLPIIWPEEVEPGYFDDMWNEDGTFDNGEPIDLGDCKRWPNAPHCKSVVSNAIDLFDFSPLDIEVFDDGCQKIWSVNVGLSIAQLPGMFFGRRDPACSNYVPDLPSPPPYVGDSPVPPNNQRDFLIDAEPVCNRVLQPYQFIYSSSISLYAASFSMSFTSGTASVEIDGEELTLVWWAVIRTDTFVAKHEWPSYRVNQWIVNWGYPGMGNFTHRFRDVAELFGVADAVPLEEKISGSTLTFRFGSFGSWLVTDSRGMTRGHLSDSYWHPDGYFVFPNWGETDGQYYAVFPEIGPLPDLYVCPLRPISYSSLEFYYDFLESAPIIPDTGIRFLFYDEFAFYENRIGGYACGRGLAICELAPEITPPPLPRKPPMTCCNQSTRLTALLLKEIRELREKETGPLHARYVGADWGEEGDGIEVPTSLLTTEEGNDDTTEVRTWPQLFLWFVRQFDALAGEWPIEIEIEQPQQENSGGIGSGGVIYDPVTIKLANISECLAEIYGLTTSIEVDADTSVAFLLRLASEAVQSKVMMMGLSDYVRAITDYLDFPGKEVARDLALNFSGFKLKANKKGDVAADYERTEDVRDILKNSVVQVRGYQFNNTEDTLTDAMQKLLYAAAIIKAVHVRSPEPGEPDANGRKQRDMLDTIGDIASIIGAGASVAKLFDKDGNEITMDWNQFLKDLNDPDSPLNRGQPTPSAASRSNPDENFFLDPDTGNPTTDTPRNTPR